MRVTNADAFKRLFEGLYATEMWSWPERVFLEWLNDDYAGSALPEYLDRPICQCCGKPIDHLIVNMFAYDGIDSFEKTELTYIKGSDCVIISTTPHWTGYDLDDEERKETIVCPECGKYPFDPDIKIQLDEPVNVQMWLANSDGEKVVPEDD
mgnify:CR=1 FL=1